MVTPAIGLRLLSTTTPLILVCAGSPGTFAEVRNVAGDPELPAKLASTTLFVLASFQTQCQHRQRAPISIGSRLNRGFVRRCCLHRA